MYVVSRGTGKIKDEIILKEDKFNSSWLRESSIDLHIEKAR